LNVFVANIQTFIATVDNGEIPKTDETCLILDALSCYTRAPRGTEGVQVMRDVNPKQSYTVTATVTASREKLPLQIIVQGKTHASLRLLTDVGEHTADFSVSGWQTLETFLRFLQWLRNLLLHQHGRTLSLLLDCYSVHRSAAARAAVVPAGLTDQMQPLDRLVFGTVRATYHRLYREGLNSGAFARVGKKPFLSLLIPAWSKIPEAAIIKGWSVFQDL
jgi:hypothetical protein